MHTSVHNDPTSCSGDGEDVEVTAPSGVGDDRRGPEDEELLPDGAKVGRYTVLTRVGAGGMGIVYSAFDPELDRKVALKVMHQRLDPRSGSVGGRERLLREAQAMAKLSHPNVITVHDVGTFDGRVFIAMEFVDGPTLRTWSDHGPHEWPEIVEVFVKAGRGLAAAHAVGLVHRDFKPDNVLIGRGQRVLVMDFGLARQSSTRTSEAQTTGQPSVESTVPPKTRDLVLTRTGALVGTPAYMAPEQHRGAPANPLVDQFSFCVALYESLYGERPFAGTSVTSLALNVLEGNIRSAPKGSRIPSWLRAAVVRGLATDPQDRFPSMDALLAELQRDPPVARHPWLTAAIAVGVTAAVGGTYLMTRAPQQDHCRHEDDRLADVWGTPQREALRETFSATGLPYADTSGQSTVRILDDWSTRWSQQWVQMCRASSEPNPSALPGIRCLDVQRQDLGALVSHLVEADRGTVERAVMAATLLPEPERCEAVELDLSISDRVSPESTNDRMRLEQLRESLADARAQLRTGAPADADRMARALIKLAEAIGDPGLEAEVRLVLARALDAQDEPGQAERQLRQAVLQAASGRRPGLEATLWVEMVRLIGDRPGQHAQGHRIALAAEAAIVRAHEPPMLRARLSSTRAAIELDQGRYDEAREHLERTIALLEEHPHSPVLVLAQAWQDLGTTLDGLGRFEEAKSALERTQTIREQSLGAQHQQVGATLARLGGTMLGSGLQLQADATFVRARWILDPEHATADPDASLPETLSVEQRRELATVIDRQGLLQRLDEEPTAAEALHRRSLVLLEKTLGPRHRDLGYPLINLGLALTEQQRPLEAIAYLRRALEIWSAELDPEHPDLGVANLDLANTLWAMREYDQARQHYAEALRIWEESLPEDHPLTAYALTGLGRSDLARGAVANAVESLERAYALRDHEDEDHLNIAETSLVLARALWKQGGDRTRAIDLAVRARDLVGAVEPTGTVHLQRLLAGDPVPRFTDQLVPAGLGAINRNTRGH